MPEPTAMAARKVSAGSSGPLGPCHWTEGPTRMRHQLVVQTVLRRYGHDGAGGGSDGIERGAV
jgi:hypothetical protein